MNAINYLGIFGKDRKMELEKNVRYDKIEITIKKGFRVKTLYFSNAEFVSFYKKNQSLEDLLNSPLDHEEAKEYVLGIKSVSDVEVRDDTLR